tara:strand:+ start:10212 stop:10670 length:459 start_codon:yes stop_codon:yes gene_type:complete
MQHEFKFAGDTVEVTVARDSQTWYLGDLECQIMADGRLKLTVNGVTKFAHSTKVGDVWWVHIDGHVFCIEKTEPGSNDDDSQGGMVAPMPGKIIDVLVEQGQSVTAGDLLLVMEAMKMEHRIVANMDGVIGMLKLKAGDQVQQGDVLVEISE